jgi:hypothetical protein
MRTFNKRNCMNKKMKIPVRFAPVSDWNSWEQPIVVHRRSGVSAERRQLESEKDAALCRGAATTQDSNVLPIPGIKTRRQFLATNKEGR